MVRWSKVGNGRSRTSVRHTGVQPPRDSLPTVGRAAGVSPRAEREAVGEVRLETTGARPLQCDRVRLLPHALGPWHQRITAAAGQVREPALRMLPWGVARHLRSGASGAAGLPSRTVPAAARPATRDGEGTRLPRAAARATVSGCDALESRLRSGTLEQRAGALFRGGGGGGAMSAGQCEKRRVCLLRLDAGIHEQIQFTRRSRNLDAGQGGFTTILCHAPVAAEAYRQLPRQDVHPLGRRGATDCRIRKSHGLAPSQQRNCELFPADSAWAIVRLAVNDSGGSGIRIRPARPSRSRTASPSPPPPCGRP